MTIREDARKQIINEFNQQNKDVSIYEIYGDKTAVFRVTSYGINWSALGTRDVATTKRMIETLKKAVEIVEQLNNEVQK